MEIEVINQIVSQINTYMDNGYLVKAVSWFRGNTGWTLLDSKDFIQKHYPKGGLFNAMCDEFLDTPEDLLLLAKAELTKLEERIQDLEAKVAAKYDVPIDSIDEFIQLAQDGTVLLAELFLGGKPNPGVCSNNCQNGLDVEAMPETADPTKPPYNTWFCANHNGLNNNVEY